MWHIKFNVIDTVDFPFFSFFFSFFARAGFNVWGALLKFLHRQDQFIVHQVMAIIKMFTNIGSTLHGSRECTLIFDKHVVSYQFTETRLVVTLRIVIKSGNLEKKDSLCCQSLVGRPRIFKDYIVLINHYLLLPKHTELSGGY